MYLCLTLIELKINPISENKKENNFPVVIFTKYCECLTLPIKCDFQCSKLPPPGFDFLNWLVVGLTLVLKTDKKILVQK